MRIIREINDGWKFTTGQESTDVTLPHLAPAENGLCFYERYLDAIPEGRVMLEFDGVSSVCEVQLNCVKLGVHKGGFSKFRYDITDSIRHDCVLGVTVSGSDFDDVLSPANQGVYGMHRGVKLIVTGECRFSSSDYSSDGLYVTPFKKDDVWYLGIKALIDRHAPGAKIGYKLFANTGEIFASKICDISESETYIRCGNPHLWQGRKDPYLYNLIAEIILADGTVSDNLTVKTGFRDFEFSADEGAKLCGEKIDSCGVYLNRADALSALQNGCDVNLIKADICQQSEEFYSFCDENGILVVAGIPAGGFARGKLHSAKTQLLELIKQTYNHPSIVCRNLGCCDCTDESRDETENGLKILNALAKSVDSIGYTSCDQPLNLSISSSLNSVTDIVFYNLCENDKTGEWLKSWRSFNREKALAVICDNPADIKESADWLCGIFACEDKPAEIENTQTNASFGFDDRLGDVLASEEAKRLIRAEFGNRLEVLFSPLAKPIGTLKAGTAMKLMKRAGMSEDTATKLEIYLKSIKK